MILSDINVNFFVKRAAVDIKWLHITIHVNTLTNLKCINKNYGFKMSQQNTLEKDGCCINAKWTTSVYQW